MNRAEINLRPVSCLHFTFRVIRDGIAMEFPVSLSTRFITAGQFMKLKTLILAACFAIMAVFTMTPTTAEAAVCGQGQYSATGESPCMRCPKGTSELWRGSKSCSPCPAGKYAAGTGSIVCDRCSGGYYSAEEGSSSCTICPKGTFSLEGMSKCDKCQAGFFFPGEGGNSVYVCQPCRRGTYSPAGSAACSLCPAGTYGSTESETERVSLARACQACPAGTASSQAGKANRESCQTCPAGTYAPAGAATCISCRSGQGSLPGSSSCVTCNDQPWTWQKCNKNQCPKAANKNSAGDCKCKKAHNWDRRQQKCVKK